MTAPTGPLSDWLTKRMGGQGMVWLILGSLAISPFCGLWAYSADTVMDFYLRFSLYSLILTLWLPPCYALMLGLVLPRMRGITFSTYMIIQTLLGLGIGPYLVGIVADKNGGDIAGAIMSVNVVSPFIVLLLLGDAEPGAGARSEQREADEAGLSLLAIQANVLIVPDLDAVVEFVVEEGVAARGDVGLLKVALENLMGNAWKFTGKTEHAKVELGSKTSDTKVEYFVRDSGAGFDMAFADKLFGAFQRLHSANEFQGSGIGLATVARVIHKHGGSVRAESIVGQGATFWFSLRP